MARFKKRIAPVLLSYWTIGYVHLSPAIHDDPNPLSRGVVAIGSILYQAMEEFRRRVFCQPDHFFW